MSTQRPGCKGTPGVVCTARPPARPARAHAENLCFLTGPAYSGRAGSGKEGGPQDLGSLDDGQEAGPVEPGGPMILTHSTEVCKPVLPLLGVDQVIPALLGGCPLQHCFKQRVDSGTA